MKCYTVIFSEACLSDLQSISDYICTVSIREHAIRYARNLRKEIESLSWRAETFPVSPYRTVTTRHPNARHFTSRNKKWTIIFHIEGDYVIIDKILASQMIAG